MTMSIVSQLVEEGAQVYYDPDWLRVIETHLTYLRNHPDTVVRAIEPIDGVKYQGDFGGLLYHYGVLPQYHLVILRMNNLASPTEYTSDILSLLVPSTTAVDKIRQVYQTTVKKLN